ncbi:MAG: hypothetical protein FJ291_06500 [Planctomycetes bacterium]|nr:hypothetical protein [Planctomycetota bacterium]
MGARASDPRLGLIVPRAATTDLAELSERRIHVWNPTPRAIKATITAEWQGGRSSAKAITAPPRQAVRLVLSR